MREQQQPPIWTLQDVLDALMRLYANGEIDGAFMGEANCAIRRYCAVAGKPPAKCKADVVDLFACLDLEDALKAGLRPDRWSNVKSLLRRSLRRAGKPTPPARRNTPLAPDWNRMLTRHPDKDVQTRLRPFAGWCTDHRIAPADVTETILERYQEHVRAVAKSSNIPDTIKKLRKSWNKFALYYCESIRFRADTWKHPLFWGKDVTVMPQSFQDEMELFRRARSPATYAVVFRCRPLKHDKAVEQQCQLIMRIVTVLEHVGHKLAEITSFAYLVQPHLFQEIMLGLMKQTKVEDLRQLGAYASMLHWLAEKWVKVDDVTLKALKQAKAVVGNRRQEISESSLDVLDQIDDPVKRHKLKQLADTVHAEFRARGELATRDDAEDFRDALYWELGLTTGWRPSTRARINHETDIAWTGTRRNPIATVIARKSEEKTELRGKVELPVSTSLMLRDFVEFGRPLLLLKANPENPYLFTGKKPNKHIMSVQLSSQSEKLIAHRTNVVGASGHKSRHVSVKLHLIENPGDWGTAQEHVGHRHPDTTKTFYANVTQVEASKRVQKSLGKR